MNLPASTIRYLFVSISSLSFLNSVSLGVPPLSDEQAQRIGHLIWKNECNGTVEGLTTWNPGEAFPSLGIGHFIWYPTGTTGPYQESFPGMIAFLEQEGIPLPTWLKEANGCPWPNRDSFLKDLDGPRLSGLRKLLQETVSLQARYAAQRFENSLPTLLDSVAPAHREEIKKKFTLIARHPQGLYALMDYVNFKGEGTNPEERYRGTGWGLLQVLEEMKPASQPDQAVHHFADAAIAILTRRISLAPEGKNEERWLAGWKKRCHSYRP